LVRNMIQLLQHWEGYVLEVNSETFLARLCPIFGEGGDLEAEIYIKFAPVKSVEIGAVFDWKIGYENETPFSTIIFRPFEVWTDEEIAEAQKQAEVWVALFNGEKS
jgi:hypothetical protein